MEIIYLKDKKLEFRSTLLEGLKKYNKTFTGETKSEIMNIYIIDEGKVIGGCQTEMEWNWVYIEAIYFENIFILKAMLSALYSYYRGKVEGLYFETYLKEHIDAFISSGFRTLGKFEDKPRGHVSHVLINQIMNNIEHDKSFNLKVFHGESEFDQAMENLVKKFKQLNNYDDTKIHLQYIAYDGDQIIGGVNGYLNQNYLYVSLLWVKDSYRKQFIASRLMDLIEEDAKEKGYDKFFLGTCTFQAKAFYEKRGYKIKMIVPNCPIDYEDFTMVKLSGREI